MKTGRMAILLMALTMMLLLTACVVSNDTKQYFAVDTGDEIVLEIDKKTGYKIVFNDPYLIIKEGKTYLEGGFGEAILYDHLTSIVPQDSKASVVDEFEKDGNKYLVFATDETGNCGSIEYFTVIWIGQSNTCATLISTMEKEEVLDALSAITFTLRTTPKTN